MIYAASTNIGRRVQNEDSLLLPSPGGPAVFAVADGMGGHAAGRRASSLAVEEVAASFSDAAPDDPIRSLRIAVNAANRSVYVHGLTEPGCRGMGTTLVLALAFGEEFAAANIGDSRLYCLHGGALIQVTEDHSLVNLMVRSGAITAEEAALHPQRNIITRAVGTQPYEEADYFCRPWEEGDMLLLCSDGLHGVLTDAQIASELNADRPLQQTADALVARALEQGGTDNITVVLVRNTGGDAV